MPDQARPRAVAVRNYDEGDAVGVGVLIADTYGEFNLAFAPPEERGAFLGPFQYARSEEAAHREAIAAAIRAPIVLVAEAGDGQVVGVLRGGRRDERQRTVLQSLFVKGTHQRQGVARRLVARFEEVCRLRGDAVIRLSSTLYAVPFYVAVGYKKSTGTRKMRSFEGTGLPYQPMKKLLAQQPRL